MITGGGRGHGPTFEMGGHGPSTFDHLLSQIGKVIQCFNISGFCFCFFVFSYCINGLIAKLIY